jgi:glycosyltransferase involved in cell wall biosynthesis
MTDQDYILELPMCVYNHEKYIAQAIEGVVRQKTNYKYRLLIGEDCSTDGSRAIIEKYAALYPDKVFPLYHAKNVGAFENSKSLFRQCTGKYIALCDGDDYWTDPYKLEQQIGFLEKNPAYVGCFHNTEERYEDDPDAASQLYCHYRSARSISFTDLSYGNVMPTCSVVYRRGLFEKFPDWYYTMKMGDWPLHLLNARFGEFWYIPRIMGVHRLHKKSVWMLQDADRINQFIIDGFDIMVKGFGDNPAYVRSLSAGKEAFLKQIREQVKAASAQRRGYKTKAKDLMIRMINKL